ncbi:MAG: hypothetical protein V2G41_08795 [bacterium JZ-2024 1]
MPFLFSGSGSRIKRHPEGRPYEFGVEGTIPRSPFTAMGFSGHFLKPVASPSKPGSNRLRKTAERKQTQRDDPSVASGAWQLWALDAGYILTKKAYPKAITDLTQAVNAGVAQA